MHLNVSLALMALASGPTADFAESHSLTRSVYDNAVGILGERFSDTDLQIDRSEYRQEAQSAEVETYIRFTDAAFADQDGSPDITLRHHMDHRPDTENSAIATVTTVIVIGETMGDLASIYSGDNQLRLTSYIRPDGSQFTPLHSDSSQGTSDKGEHYDWQGMEGRLISSKQQDRYVFELAIPGASLKSDKSNGELINLAVDLDIEKGPYGLWLGKRHLTLDHFSGTFLLSDGSTIESRFDGLELAFEQRIEEGLLSGSTSMKSGMFTTTYGQTLQDMYMSLEYHRVDPKLVTEIYTAMSDAFFQGPDAVAGLLSRGPVLINQLFSTHPRIALGYGTTNDDRGKVHLNIEVNVLGDWDDAIISNPKLLLDRLEVNLTGSFALKFIELQQRERLTAMLREGAAKRGETLSDNELSSQVDAMMARSPVTATIAASGLGRIEDEDVLFDIQLRPGELLINGVPRPDLLQLLERDTAETDTHKPGGQS